MVALFAILGIGLAICAGEAITIARRPVRRAQCADCHSAAESSTVVMPLSTIRSLQLTDQGR